MTYDELLRVLAGRYARRPFRAVAATTRILGRVTRALPARPIVRAALDRGLGPGMARSIRWLRPLFDFARPDDDRYWARTVRRWAAASGVGSPPSSFARAVYAWLGVEGSAMTYGDTWRVLSLDDRTCVERVYLRDEAGRRHAGCPWGMAAAGDGFACRTVMTGARHLFAALGAAEMRIDISIPEMQAAAGVVRDHLRAHLDQDPEARWRTLEPRLIDVFRASQPDEADFLAGGRLRPETAAILRALVSAVAAGGEAPAFCQFRIVATHPAVSPPRRRVSLPIAR